LKSKEAVQKIVAAAKLTDQDTVLEIGPGKGVLTAELLKHAGRVIAIEKDQRLIPLLNEQFATEVATGKLSIIEGDILEIDVASLFPKPANSTANPSYKVVANIPYYITGILIRNFLTANVNPNTMVLLVQKEVAQRIVARDGKESLLSMSVRAFATPKYIQTVQAKYFSPEPKVDSAIIALYDISKEFFNKQPHLDEDLFFTVLRTGFAHKRKIVAGNLKNLIPHIKEILATLDVPATTRPENLTLDAWRTIALAK
jgi:16S rRNA (adenine1518-N6/adenine1519-N6)-dimethyltransferase